ncbi:WAP-type (Whey acidic protein) 'four-disulfide core' domain-containing protein [Ditylenchus destructor]|nr:WAP-type (Whey acidic protein) 'four-disulfide core' domain-containing protein [Ditylenchus destructor]
MTPLGTHMALLLTIWAAIGAAVDMLISSSSEESGGDNGSADLLAARCQSKCLFELEQRHKNNTDVRRQLRHASARVCKEDPQCSSCILPCRESFFDHHTCSRTLCQETLDHANCQESCAFLEKVNQKKPGTCPRKILPISTSECSAMCDHDGDCPEIEKCCTSGCSRKCVSPILHDQRLLPIPEGITIQERKRKRSAIVRWIMKRMSAQHVSTNSNLFVIQWRWSIHKNEETMTPWQTIMVRNKMYAILKHLLAPGRYYTFRVASVNVHGTYGFSRPSYPLFKLSKEVKAPSAPSNLSVDSMEYDTVANNWIARVGWVPPNSDLPLKDYQLSWWKSTASLASAYQQNKAGPIQQQLKRSPTEVSGEEHMDDEVVEADYTDTGFGRKELENQRRAMIVPSYATTAEIVGLDAGHVYMIELLATAESSEGELKGEPAVLFVQTNRSVPSTPLQPTTVSGFLSTVPTIQKQENYHLDEIWSPLIENHQPGDVPDIQIYRIDPLIDELPSIDNKVDSFPTVSSVQQNPVIDLDDALLTSSTRSFLELTRYRARVKTPYYEKGHLRTSVSWLDHPTCSKQPSIFRVYIRTTSCINELPPQQFQVRHCVATFENLQFQCEYFVEVEALPLPDALHLAQMVTRMTFITLPCAQTPSEFPLRCHEITSKSLQDSVLATPATDFIVDNTPNDQLNHLPTSSVQAMPSLLDMPDPPRPEIRLTGSESVKCEPTSQSMAQCVWKPISPSHTLPMLGYRLMLVSDNNSSSNVSVVSATTHHVEWHGLDPRTKFYRFRLQPITTHGVGSQIEVKFSLARDEPKEQLTAKKYPVEHSVKLQKNIEQIAFELPLEASASTSVFRYRNYSMIFVQICDLLRILALTLIPVRCII